MRPLRALRLLRKKMAEYRSTGKELRKSPKGFIAGILALLLVVGAAFGASRVLNGMEELETAPNPAEESELDVPALDSTEESSEDAIEYGSAELSVSWIRHGALALVNNDYPTEDIDTGIIRVVDKKSDIVSVRDMDVYLMEEAVDAFNQMAAAFQKATEHKDLLIMNGYITKDAQKQLYEQDLQRTGGNSSELYDVPGCSEYETGYSFQLALFDGRFHDFTGEDEYAWIIDHCAEYGFIQRYPENKSDFTGVSGKTDIFRYVGIPHAWFMKKNDLCLEEYITVLEGYPHGGGEHLRLNDPIGRSYEAYYISIDPSMTAEKTMIPVPKDYQWTFSGNNKHGFFVTVELGWQDQDTWGADSTAAPETAAP